jgi:hypothetical protein
VDIVIIANGEDWRESLLQAAKDLTGTESQENRL